MFISHSTLEAWLDSGGVEVQENIVRVRASGDSVVLEPAVRFLSVESGDAALVSDLLGKVLTEARIGELAGEILGDSVLLGETAFLVKPGYIGTLMRDSARSPEAKIREAKIPAAKDGA